MFRGLTAVKLDTKGRMAIPSRYRDNLKDDANGQLVVTIETEDPCLLIYPLPAWEVIEEKIESLPSFDPAARRIQRLLIGHASEVELDSQGRILLPPLLREYAGLDKEGMLVGQGKKFELWSEHNWLQGRALWLEDQAKGSLPTDLQTLSL